MSSALGYTFFRVPKSGDGVDKAIESYKDLRLKALQQSPESFSSTYETELAFSTSTWRERLCAPGRELFVCAVKSDNSTPSPSPSPDESAPAMGEWVAQVTLLGPCSRESFVLPAEANQPDPGSDDEEERWQLLSLYTLLDHRGKRLGKLLCQAAMDHLATYRLSPGSVRVRLMVKMDNVAAVKMYEQLGFDHTGICTRLEGLVGNGDAHLAPSDAATNPEWNSRGGYIMTKMLSRQN